MYERCKYYEKVFDIKVILDRLGETWKFRGFFVISVESKNLGAKQLSKPIPVLTLEVPTVSSCLHYMDQCTASGRRDL